MIKEKTFNFTLENSIGRISYMFLRYLLPLFLVGLCFEISAQTRPLSPEAITRATYVSLDDRDLFIKRILVEVSPDNVGGIYSEPLTIYLLQLIEEDRLWSLTEGTNSFSKESSRKRSNEVIKTKTVPQKSIDYEEEPDEIQQALNSSGAEGFLELRISKDPNGINLRLTLYTKKDGQLLTQEKTTSFSKFEISDVKKELSNLYSKLIQKLPFRGFVLSRQAQQVTFNIGTRKGLKAGDEVDLIQILKIHRHPKLHFMVGVEKEILGKAKIFKADDSMSFAKIIFEKEPGVIGIGSKVWPPGYTNYSNPIIANDGTVVDENPTSTGDEKFFGKRPDEWLPQDRPQYGQVALLGGIGQYAQSGSLLTSGAYNANNNLMPSISLKAEIWLNSDWALGFTSTQSVFDLPNPITDSSPSKLIMSLSEYSFYVGYNILLNENFFGPKVEFTLGSHSTQYNPDQGDPVALTSMSYGGNYLGFLGRFQLIESLPLELGLYCRYFLTKLMKENPTSGGSSSSNLSAFGFMGYYRINPRLKWMGEFSVEYASTSFSGTGTRGENSASKISHKLHSLNFGIEYSF